MHTFQIAILLVFALVFAKFVGFMWYNFFLNIMYFVYISTYLSNMLVIE